MVCLPCGQNASQPAKSVTFRGVCSRKRLAHANIAKYCLLSFVNWNLLPQRVTSCDLMSPGGGRNETVPNQCRKTRSLTDPLKSRQRTHCDLERQLCGFNPMLVLIMRKLKHNPVRKCQLKRIPN